MKHILTFLFVLFAFVPANTQSRWFRLYADSLEIVTDANAVSDQFISDVKKVAPEINLTIKTVLNTSPYFIYYNDKVANISLWKQLNEQHKNIVYEIAGGKKEGEKIFGLFFNGFYLPHELGHGLQHMAEGSLQGAYKNEYFANIVAMLWWRKQGKYAELAKCYKAAKKMLRQLPNPVPQGKTTDDFFTENYKLTTKDPKVYGYMQFSQFVKIYEDKTLPDFDTFIKSYLNK